METKSKYLVIAAGEAILQWINKEQTLIHRTRSVVKFSTSYDNLILLVLFYHILSALLRLHKFVYSQGWRGVWTFNHNVDYEDIRGVEPKRIKKEGIFFYDTPLSGIYEWFKVIFFTLSGIAFVRFVSLWACFFVGVG